MKLVILDRDGTINEDRDDFVKSADEWVPVPGALEAIARLNHAGWHTVIASNQSGLARGLFDMAALNAIHARMNRELPRSAAGSTRSSSARTGPTTAADAASRCPGCSRRSPTATASTSRTRTSSATRCATCRRAWRSVASRISCGPGKAGQLDSAELAAVQSAVPGTRIHADLGAFVQELLHEEQIERGDSAEPDSVFGAL